MLILFSSKFKNINAYIFPISKKPSNNINIFFSVTIILYSAKALLKISKEVIL